MQHRARKRFGQNFLVDDEVVARIVAVIAPRPGERLVEIGPGLGALTRPLLETGARLDVVELDRDLASTLAHRLGDPPALTIHAADALTFDFAALAADGPLRVVGNLPYNISTPLLFHLLEQADAIADMHFMLQREVVERLVAGPGRRARGRLGVMAQLRATITPLLDVPPDAFRPAPKVDSAVVRLVPKALSDSQRAHLPHIEKIARAAFAQKRKTLRNTLAGHLDADTMASLGIDPQRRAETLTLDEFTALAEAARESTS
ncbi:MAG: 16S rRNA (adenine(1518)-N(6)/adenine(1519)-N(6))-dimethyltransferase RsmA [Wenzhouxiangellaceae bacterium]|nr:16S rRNA (adenine(1518)-N(6)/adenine(1519)-N(6))-dimethyltransferase RsmA [Wenzhouxiangellaceae bacterium]